MKNLKIAKFLIRKAGKGNTRYLLDFFSFGAWYIISAVVALLVNVLINSNLTPEEFGKYSYARSILDLLAVSLTLQLYASYLRFNTNGVSSVLKGLVYKVTLVTTIVLGVIAFFITRNLFAVLFCLIIVYNERMYMARSVMDVKSVNLIKMLSVTVTFLFILGLKVTGASMDSGWILFALGLGYSIALFYYSKKYKGNDDKGVLTYKTIFIFTLPTLAIVIVNWLLSVSGQVIIKHYYGYEDLSHYAIAQRLIAVIKLFSGMMLMFYPMVYYREIATKKIKTIRMLRYGMSGIMLFIGLLAYIFTTQVYQLLGASQYLDYVSYFRVLVVGEVIYTISTFYGTYLGFSLQTYKSLIICAIGAIINLLILFLFLERFGIGTAAYAILISDIVMASMIYFFSYRKEREYLFVR